MQGGAGMLVAGRYLLTEAVGQGGMGRVWRGHDQLLDRVVAVKEVILPVQSPDGHAELLARTMREARAAARLNHPSVITIHDVVEHEGTPWIVMQFIAGTSLRALINKVGRLSWQEVADIGQQVAEALAVAHAAGIVHRDLKPDNILLSGRRAIVTDFGIARIADATTQLTGTGVLIGTPAYMAPEHLDGGRSGPAADMWALGATLYTAVEGTAPFAGETMGTLITAILTRAPALPQHAGPILEVLSSLLSKDPAQRPDAQHTVRAIAACRAGRAVTEPAFAPLLAVADTRTAVTGQPYAATAAARTGDPGPFPPHTAHPSLPGLPTTDSPPASGKARRRRLPRSAIVVAVLAVAAAIAGTVLAQVGGSQSPGAAPPTAQGTSTSAPTVQATTGKATAGKAASLLGILTNPGGNFCVALGPNGILASGSDNGNTYLWDIATQSITATLTDPDGAAVEAVAFGPDGTLAVGDESGNVYLWDIASGTSTATYSVQGSEAVTSLAFSPDDRLAAGFQNGSTYMWDTSTSTQLAYLSAPNGGIPAAVAFDSDDTLAVADLIQEPAMHDSGATYLYSAMGALTATLQDPQSVAPMTLAFNPDGTLAVGGENDDTYLWDTNTGSLTATLAGPQGEFPTGMAFGPNGTLAVVSTGCSGACLGSAVPSGASVWNTATRSVIATLPAAAGWPTGSLAYASDGTVAVSDGNANIYLWHVSAAKP